ncbi:NAD-dependent epimerase/dehydratase family protein [Nocardia rhamnosiphila]|uniref:NAD-dependent epimerase/dehydratase family protein n=1 Tax=Nocardia rhamnosiphila TaxID=426716 RepID=A0ABV2WZG5_9NOCA|nr:NAD-dependent epimerase/dehydratase family protein [Nocardia rhamnosiphila]
MKILVLGGYGAVGSHLVALLRRRGDSVLAAGRDPVRADVVVDLADPALTQYSAALAGVDIVVNASGAEDSELAARAGAAGCAFVDVTATAGYIDELRRSASAGPVVVDVGLAPGLTDLLAVAVHAESPGPIDLAVVLGAGERHGAAATEWSYRLLGRHFDDGGERIRNYSRPAKFLLPGQGKPRLLYRLDFSDQHTLRREFGVPVRTYFGLDSRFATTALAVLTWLPGSAHAPRVHLPGSEEWIVLARGADGITRWAQGSNQSRATAAVAAVATARAPRLSPGVHALHEVLTLTELSVDGIEIGGAGH